MYEFFEREQSPAELNHLFDWIRDKQLSAYLDDLDEPFEEEIEFLVEEEI